MVQQLPKPLPSHNYGTVIQVSLTANLRQEVLQIYCSCLFINYQQLHNFSYWVSKDTNIPKNHEVLTENKKETTQQKARVLQTIPQGCANEIPDAAFPILCLQPQGQPKEETV